MTDDTTTLQQPDENLRIEATDDPGPGGAYHNYRIHGSGITNFVRFQKGGIAEVGVNGITNEALLEIVRHRLECFQRGPFACNANAEALVGVDKALASLYARTAERRARGVEGKSVT